MRDEFSLESAGNKTYRSRQGLHTLHTTFGVLRYCLGSLLESVSMAAFLLEVNCLMSSVRVEQIQIEVTWITMVVKINNSYTGLYSVWLKSCRQTSLALLTFVM